MAEDSRWGEREVAGNVFTVVMLEGKGWERVWMGVMSRR